MWGTCFYADSQTQALEILSHKIWGINLAILNFYKHLQETLNFVETLQFVGCALRNPGVFKQQWLWGLADQNVNFKFIRGKQYDLSFCENYLSLRVFISEKKKKKDSMGIFVGLNEILSVKWLIFNWQF